MNKKDKAIEYYDYLVKTNPNKNVELKFYIRVFDKNCVEASCQPFLLDKECIFTVVEYVISGNSGTKNIQLYFNNEGETFDFAPFENGQLKIDLRQAWSGYSGNGYYECTYNNSKFNFSYYGAPNISYLEFYQTFLDYVKLVAVCSTQKEVDYLKKCLEKDIKIAELNKENLEKQAKVSLLEDLIETHKDLITKIETLIK